MNSNDIVARAWTFCNHRNITPADFERISGLANGMFKRLSKATRQSTYKKISTAFPDLNMIWLKTGEGDMLNPNCNINQMTGGAGQRGLAGNNLNQSINSDKVVHDFLEAIKIHSKLIERVMDQTDKAIQATSRAMDQTDRAQESIDRLIALLEKSSES